MFNLQGAMDALNDACKQERSYYHLKLGELIDSLIKFDQKSIVKTSNGNYIENEAYSYRGYYSDLAIHFTPYEENACTVEELYSTLSEILDTELIGYKGGDFLMDKDVPLWISNCRSVSTNWAVIGIDPDQPILTIKELDY